MQSGFEAEVALSAPVGLSIIEERHMDAAVLNARIGHDGDWELVRKLKESNPRVRVVLFDAPKEKGLSREARRVGVSKFILMPSDVEHVLAETSKVI